ncbi:helix-turn-helix domain-containing protein [Burkholderia cenocepacia]|uniref:helix-turn-helix domain-containing protein n=1 Tax=Burkholderia cenocepacia TaxID=95486 RepID=UPI0038B86E51
MRYLWCQRLDRAHQILSASHGHGLRIEEVAWRCGFSSAAHFSRRFRERFGQTPTEWRQGLNAGACES